MSLTKDIKSGLEIVPLIINGEERAIDPSRLFEVRSSVLDKAVYLAHRATKQDAINAADAAWKAFHTWKHVSGSRRREIFLRAADLVNERGPQLAEMMAEEISCNPEFAYFQVKFVVQMLREL